MLMYAYIALGLGYYLKKGFLEYRERVQPVLFIGIIEKIPTSIDHLFEENRITRLD